MAGKPDTGLGQSLPSRITRKFPAFSVMSVRPSGRKATAHGEVSPLAIVSTLTVWRSVLIGASCANTSGTPTAAARASTHDTLLLNRLFTRVLPWNNKKIRSDIPSTT
jgi:hypothetical protein